MKPNLSRILAIALIGIGATTASHLRAQDTPSVDPTQILQALEDMKEKHVKSYSDTIAQAKRQIESASASPGAAIDLYEKAYMATRIEGKNRDNTEFRDWKDNNDAMLSDSAARTAVQIHLRYLGLTLKRASGEELEDLMPELVSYTSSVMAAGDLKPSENSGAGKGNKGGGGRGGKGPANQLIREMMDQPITQGVFVKLFGLENSLSGLKDWVMAPGKADEIVMKVILPELRKQKSPQVIEYWDDRIAREQATAANSELAFQANNFKTLRKPELLWSRATEYQKMGMPNRSVDEMFAVVKAYPTHPMAGTWIEEIKTLVMPAPTAAPETDSAAPVPEESATLESEPAQ